MDNWNEIVTAWAAWVNAEGPMVQGRNSCGARAGQWVDWDDRDRLARRCYDEWRIKPLPNLARMLYSPVVSVSVVTKPWDTPTPDLCPGEYWIGEWQEIPD